MTGETKGKKSLKRYFPYKEYVIQNGQTIKPEFGFSLLDKGVYVTFLSKSTFFSETGKNLAFPVWHMQLILCSLLFGFATRKLDSYITALCLYAEQKNKLRSEIYFDSFTSIAQKFSFQSF